MKRRRPSIRRALASVAIAAASFGADDGNNNHIALDEEVLFFPSMAHRSATGGWEASVHGWIFEPERDSLKRRALLRVLGKALNLDDEDHADELALFQERARAFLVDNKHNKNISIDLANQPLALDRSIANGHFGCTLVLDPTQLIASGMPAEPWRIPFLSSPIANDQRRFPGEIHLIEDQGLSIITDIDDTIKISECGDARALMKNTFLLPYRAVPGMADLYRAWAKQGARFHYVSASPWQLYAPLRAFLDHAGFPPGTWHLKQFRWKDETFFDLFKPPDAHKLAAIEPILAAFPKRTFILVGDAGQSDARVYAELAHRHPGQVTRIFIRTLNDEQNTQFATSQRSINTTPNITGFREPSELPVSFR